MVRVCAGGDVSLGTNLDTTWTRLAMRRLGRPVAAIPSPDSLLAPLRPLVADADLVLLNVEGAIGSGRTGSKCGPRSTACYALRMPERAAAAFRGVASESAVVVGNVANNHARDAGLPGFAATQRNLADAGVLVTGADTLATLAVTARGDTVALLGFSTSGSPDARDLAAVRRHVARAAATAARVVVTMHLGAEGVGAAAVRDTTERYYDVDRGNPVAFARAAVEAGADLVVGHGPHLLRAAEWRDSSLVAYSLGNLVTYGSFSFAPPLDRAGVLCATLDESGRPSDAVLRSTRQRLPGIVSEDETGRGARVLDSLSRADFPRTGVRVGRDGTITEPDDRSRGREPAAEPPGPRRR
jgi:poly-gamma-glutamate capsule biosynthesis protein CapA/YwtB (metallophosphatase superfamily)